LKIEEQSSLYSSTIFTSNSKTMTTQKNDIINETSSLNLLSNVTFNDKISTVLKSVTNQDDVFEQNTILQIEKNNHKKSPTHKNSTMPSNNNSDIYNEEKLPTTNEKKIKNHSKRIK